jgi:hypothetical protein
MPDIDENECGLWRTPTAACGERGAMAGSLRLAAGHSMSLQDQVADPKMWPTPRTEGFDAGAHNGKPDSLHSAVKLWPTPTSRDYKDGTAESLKNTPPNSLLGRVVHLFPTPEATDNRDRRHLGSASVQKRIAKGKQIHLSQMVSQHSGSLNPNWVEWLMGYPTGHTDLKPSAIASSRKSPASSSKQ